MREELTMSLQSAQKDAEESAVLRRQMEAAAQAAVDSQDADMRAYLGRVAPGWEDGFKAAQAARSLASWSF